MRLLKLSLFLLVIFFLILHKMYKSNFLSLNQPQQKSTFLLKGFKKYYFIFIHLAKLQLIYGREQNLQKSILQDQNNNSVNMIIIFKEVKIRQKEKNIILGNSNKILGDNNWVFISQFKAKVNDSLIVDKWRIQLQKSSKIMINPSLAISYINDQKNKQFSQIYFKNNKKNLIKWDQFSSNLLNQIKKIDHIKDNTVDVSLDKNNHAQQKINLILPSSQMKLKYQNQRLNNILDNKNLHTINFLSQQRLKKESLVNSDQNQLIHSQNFNFKNNNISNSLKQKFSRILEERKKQIANSRNIFRIISNRNKIKQNSQFNRMNIF